MLQKLVTVERQPPAELAQPCPPEPAPPPAGATDTETALYWHDVRIAGKACRARHAGLAAWAKPPGAAK